MFLSHLLSHWLHLQVQTVVKRIEIEPEYDNTNITSEVFETFATKPPPIFKEKKSLEYKSGMNVLGREQTRMTFEISLFTVYFKSESQLHCNLFQV